MMKKFSRRKQSYLLVLLVFLMSNFLVPFSYADTGDVIEINSDNQGVDNIGDIQKVGNLSVELDELKSKDLEEVDAGVQIQNLEIADGDNKIMGDDEICVTIKAKLTDDSYGGAFVLEGNDYSYSDYSYSDDFNIEFDEICFPKDEDKKYSYKIRQQYGDDHFYCGIVEGEEEYPKWDFLNVDVVVENGEAKVYYRPEYENENYNSEDFETYPFTCYLVCEDVGVTGTAKVKIDLQGGDLQGGEFTLQLSDDWEFRDVLATATNDASGFVYFNLTGYVYPYDLLVLRDEYCAYEIYGNFYVRQVTGDSRYVFDENLINVSMSGPHDYIFYRYSYESPAGKYLEYVEDGEDATFYNSVVSTEYTVSFNLDGGTGNIQSPVTVVSGGLVEKPDDPTKIGHTFTGRYTKDGQKFDFESPIDRFIQLYAKWDVNKYNVTFNTNGGTDVNPKKYGYGSDIKNIKYYVSRPTKTGYIFSGWLGIPEDGKMPARDIELTAEWTPIQYSVQFSGSKSGVNGSFPETVTLKYDTGYIPENNFTRSGYTFLGWNTQEDGSGTLYKDGQELINLATVSGKVVILYAQWSENVYVPYIAQYYFEKIDGSGYELSGNLSQYYTGIVGQEVAAKIMDFSGFVFSGTNVMNVATGVVDLDGDLVLKLYYDRDSYVLSFEVDGSVVQSGYVKYGDKILSLQPTKNGYKFSGWNPPSPETMPSYDLILKATWMKVGGSSGGGGRSSSRVSDTQDYQQSGVNSFVEQGSVLSQNDNNVSSGVNAKDQGSDTQMDSSTSSQNDGITYTQEFQDAYEFAKEKGITNADSIESAKMDGKLTRIQMAKILSQYAINVLGQVPDESRNIDFKDVTDKMDADYNNGVTLAYQLGIMGINMPNNKFRPNDEVPRKEFVAAFSRMLYHTSDGEYELTKNYYINHMVKLVGEGIITQTDPDVKERRGYVMIMLKRSAE